MSDERMTADELAAIRARYEAATPGPWGSGHLSDDSIKCDCPYVFSTTCMGAVCSVHVDNGKAIQDGGNDDPPIEEAVANQLFIAHARTDLPRCLDEIDALRAEVERLKGENVAATKLVNLTKALLDTANKEIAELEHRAEAAEALTRWRPISEAPMDGTRVLAVAFGKEPPVFTHFADAHWRAEHYGDREPYWYYSALTHFLPLPTPPANS